MSVTLECGDCLEVIPRLVAEGICVDAICTDPPYHLSEIPHVSGSGFHRVRSIETRTARSGFMGQTWDGGDIAFRPETWAIIATALRPGGFLLAFGGTRTYHKLVTAIEAGGFVIQDCLMWLYGSGFPKRRDALKPGFEPVIWARKELTTVPCFHILSVSTVYIETLLWLLMNASSAQNRFLTHAETSLEQVPNTARWIAYLLDSRFERGLNDLTDISTSPEATLTGLSIALLWNATLAAVWEKASTFTTSMESSLRTGLETLNAWISAIIPESTILAASNQNGLWLNVSDVESNSSVGLASFLGTPPLSAPVIVSPDTILAILNTLACIVERSSILSQVQIENIVLCSALDELTTRNAEPGKTASAPTVAEFLRLSRDDIRFIADANVWPPPIASPNVHPVCVAYKPGGKRTLQVDECRVPTDETIMATRNIALGSSSGGIYGRAEKPGIYEQHANGRWPANLCHDGSDEVMQAFEAFGETTSSKPRIPTGSRSRQSEFGMTDGSGGFDDTGSVSRYFYCAKADKEDRWGSRHPTVKPLELMKWLVPLVTPKGGIVLDPFAGSGTTGIAALATERNAIIIERETQYQDDIRERLAHYRGEGRHSLDSKSRNKPRKPVGGLLAELETSTETI